MAKEFLRKLVIFPYLTENIYKVYTFQTYDDKNISKEGSYFPYHSQNNYMCLHFSEL